MRVAEAPNAIIEIKAQTLEISSKRRRSRITMDVVLSNCDGMACMADSRKRTTTMSSMEQKTF